MKAFELDSQLTHDCFVLGEFDCSLLLLMNNALVPWFILVPKSNATELYELPQDVQLSVLDQINDISRFLKEALKSEKLNIAAIGNKVKQLHIHIIGRNESDFCWPNVVWGTEKRQPYSDDEVREIAARLSAELKCKFAISQHYAETPAGSTPRHSE